MYFNVMYLWQWSWNLVKGYLLLDLKKKYPNYLNTKTKCKTLYMYWQNLYNKYTKMICADAQGKPNTIHSCNHLTHLHTYMQKYLILPS